MKTCHTCKQEKELDCFYSRVTRGKTYPFTDCKECMKKTTTEPLKVCTSCNKPRMKFYKAHGIEWSKCQGCHQKEVRIKREANRPMSYKDYLIQQNQVGAFKSAIKVL